ncbi:MAG: porin [Bacteroidetes bacterium]|nr:porin [Bacteroidota bacterium]
MKKIPFLIAGILITSLVLGQDEESSETKPDKGKIIVSGYTDSYYSYNTNNPGALGSWGTNGVGRIFDGVHNQVAVNMLQTKVVYESDRLQIVGDLLFGPGAELANFGNTGTAYSIKQAYIEYEMVENLTLTVGQFGTHIGYELADAPDNFNYSISYLFGNGPFYHTGAKLGYSISDKIGVMAGILNGWDALKDNNLAKSISAQISLTPNDDVSIYLNWIGGNEDPSSLTGDSIDSYKHMFDITATFALSEKFNVGLNIAYGFYNYDTLATQYWGGTALYLNLIMTDQFSLGTRIEYFEDVSAVQYVGASYMGYTLTGIIKSPNGHFMFKPEIRYDSSNANIYWDGDAGETTNSQMTLGLAFIANF